MKTPARAVRFNTGFLRPGDVLQVRGNRFFPSRAIRAGLSVRLEFDDISPLCGPGESAKVWGNHTAMFLTTGGGLLAIGDTHPPRSEVYSLAHYEQRASLSPAAADYCALRVLRPVAWSPEAGEAAARFWLKRVDGARYDHPAYARLLLRCIIGQRWNLPAGLSGFRFCSEGVAECLDLAAAGLGFPEPVANRAATPYTFEKRVLQGRLADVSALALAEDPPTPAAAPASFLVGGFPALVW